jgi:hypothetical protein
MHLIRLCIVTIIALISVHSTGSQVNPLEFSCGLSFPSGAGDGIALLNFVAYIVVILQALRHCKMGFDVHTIVVD